MPLDQKCKNGLTETLLDLLSEFIYFDDSYIKSNVKPNVITVSKSQIISMINTTDDINSIQVQKDILSTTLKRLQANLDYCSK
jgi:hypothetical protein